MASYLKLITKFVKCFYISNYIVFYLTYNKLFCVRNFCFKTGYLSPEILALLRKKKKLFLIFSALSVPKTSRFLISDFPMKFYHYIFERTSLLLFSKKIFQKIFGAKQGKQSLHFFWMCHWFAISTISDLCRIVFWILNITFLVKANDFF